MKQDTGDPALRLIKAVPGNKRTLKEIIKEAIREELQEAA